MQSGMNPKLIVSLLTALLLHAVVLSVSGQEAGGGYQITSVKVYTLPRMSLSELGNPAVTDATMKRAEQNGLKFGDLPSIGSGLAKTGENEFVGITDRGPNGAAEDADTSAHRSFPLPEFCPTIVRFKLEGSAIRITECLPLKDSSGRPISGLSNREGEEPLYASPTSATPLPRDPNGVDPEGIRVLPGGGFVLVEEYGPSLLIVNAKGEVLMRYTPESKPLPGATYPVKAILPAALAQRRDNKGFESVALSKDGKRAYAILQASMGDAKDKRYKDNRWLRVVKLDLTKPLEAKVAGEYLLDPGTGPLAAGKDKPDKANVSDAEWLGPDKLLILSRDKDAVRIMQADFAGSTDILADPRAAALTFEDAATDLSALGVKPARTRLVFSTAQAKEINSLKLEGLTVTGPDELALSNDNDFGIGDNKNGEPSRVWLIKLNRPLTGE
jgi:alkaline phosphatase